jgi:parallel beta-helix repeat protein
MPRSTNEGLIVERDNIVLDGAGHKVQGNGQSSAILVEGRTGVTLTRFLLQGFYWGLEIRDSRQCVIAGNNLTAGMYCIYLSDSSNNKFYHNNIFGALYYSNSNNVWDNGYPSGGNFWEGYPYPDEKSGTSQDLPGSDRIGDIPVDEEIFSQGGTNVDNYPLMKSQSIADFDPNTIDSPSGTVVPTETPYPTTESSSSATADPTPSPSVPEFSSPILAGVLCISVLIAAFLFAKKNSKLNA